jgi:hypothetical protein
MNSSTAVEINMKCLDGTSYLKEGKGGEYGFKGFYTKYP